MMAVIKACERHEHFPPALAATLCSDARTSLVRPIIDYINNCYTRRRKKNEELHNNSIFRQSTHSISRHFSPFARSANTCERTSSTEWINCEFVGGCVYALHWLHTGSTPAISHSRHSNTKICVYRPLDFYRCHHLPQRAYKILCEIRSSDGVYFAFSLRRLLTCGPSARARRKALQFTNWKHIIFW